MKILVHFVNVALGLLLVTGCATRKPAPTVAAGASPRADATYAVASFVDANSGKYRDAYPDAAAVTASAFETALMQTGRRIVRLGDEDITISGVVTAFWQGHFLGRNTTVGFDVKAVEKRTGTVLWQVSQTKTTRWEYDRPPGQLARAMAREIVIPIMDAGKTP